MYGCMYVQWYVCVYWCCRPYRYISLWPEVPRGSRGAVRATETPELLFPSERAEDLAAGGGPNGARDRRLWLFPGRPIRTRRSRNLYRRGRRSAEEPPEARRCPQCCRRIPLPRRSPRRRRIRRRSRRRMSPRGSRRRRSPRRRRISRRLEAPQRL